MEASALTLREIYRAGITFWFGNHYKLDAYVLRDGKKHPFALICPGGAYMLVSEENEGHTFAAELNRRGISAFVLPLPQKGTLSCTAAGCGTRASRNSGAGRCFASGCG